MSYRPLAGGPDWMSWPWYVEAVVMGPWARADPEMAARMVAAMARLSMVSLLRARSGRVQLSQAQEGAGRGHGIRSGEVLQGRAGSGPGQECPCYRFTPITSKTGGRCMKESG